MTRTAAALLLTCGITLAAPVPKPVAKKLEDVFGSSADTPGVTLEMTRRDELKATVGKDAGAAIYANRIIGTFRPLAAKTVEGDFELTVRVTHAPPAKAELAAGTGSPTVIAGIALFSERSKESTASFFHEHVRAGDNWKTDLTMSTYSKGGSGSRRQGGKLEDQPVYLRLTRTGDEFKGETSADGKKWQALATHKVPGFGGSVVVGPYAGHNTTGEYAVTFDEYVIKTLTTEKK